jgi:hypothetical protein
VHSRAQAIVLALNRGSPATGGAKD